MIELKIYDDINSTWGSPFEARVNDKDIHYSDRMDEGWNTLTFQTTKSLLGDYTLPIKTWTKIQAIWDDGSVFYGFITDYSDSTAEWGNDHGEMLVEISAMELVGLTKAIPIRKMNCSKEIINGQPLSKKMSDIARRLNRFLWTRTDDDLSTRPLSITWDDHDWWVDIEAPELFFPDSTALEVLVTIGAVVGGRPRLTYTGTNGLYKLTYSQWNNRNTTHWMDNSWTMRVRSSSIEGMANYLVSDAKNMLCASLNNESQISVPSQDGLRATTSSSYTYVISDSDRAIRVPFGIKEIISLKANVISPAGVSESTGVDLTDLVVPYDEWRTLPTFDVIAEHYAGTISTAKRLYYKYNDNFIYNIDNALDWIKQEMSIRGGITATSVKQLTFQLTYVPYINAMVRVERGDNEKPIGSWINQGDQVISSNSYSSYLEGMVQRMQGDYTAYTFTKDRATATIYHAGEWLNDELVVQAEHSYTTESVISHYICVPEFNRRSQYKAYPHENRSWAIPENEIDTTIFYAENIECSIGTGLATGNGHLTADGLRLLSRYATSTSKPSLSYIAFKTNADLALDDNKQNNGYAMESLLAIPFGKSISLTWTMEDNASVGERAYRKVFTSTGADRQQFIAYPSQAEYMQFKVSNAKPTSYDFDSSDDYTKTGGQVENDNMNKTFENTFPMSNKKQYSDAVSLGRWGFYIYKDLRDKIISTIQLDFVGKNGTIVYNGATELSPFVNNTTSTFKVFVGGESEYSTYTQQANGTEYEVSSISSNVSANVIDISLTMANQIPDHTKIAITDGNGKLMWATNTGLQNATSTLHIYMANRMKTYKVL